MLTFLWPSKTCLFWSDNKREEAKYLTALLLRGGGGWGGRRQHACDGWHARRLEKTKNNSQQRLWFNWDWLWVFYALLVCLLVLSKVKSMKTVDKKLIMSENTDKNALSLSALYSALHVHCQSFSAATWPLTIDHCIETTGLFWMRGPCWGYWYGSHCDMWSQN